MRTTILTTLLAICSLNAISAEINNTTISKLMMNREFGNLVFIKTSGTATRGSGHCHTNTNWDYVLVVDDDFGKQAHSQLLAAYASKVTVSLRGATNCMVNNSIEVLNRVEIK